MEEDFEPIKFPEDPSVNVNIGKIGNIVSLSYEVGDENEKQLIHLQLRADDAIEFANLILQVAKEILEEDE